MSLGYPKEPLADRLLNWVLILLLLDLGVILILPLVWGGWAIIHEMLK
jgi:hypothetical protein